MSALKKKDQFVKGLRIDWDNIEQSSYRRNIRTIAWINSLAFHSLITFFVGENGSGKSTLLEAMAVAYGFNPEGGTVNYSFSTYDSHSGFCKFIDCTLMIALQPPMKSQFVFVTVMVITWLFCYNEILEGYS